MTAAVIFRFLQLESEPCCLLGLIIRCISTFPCHPGSKKRKTLTPHRPRSARRKSPSSIPMVAQSTECQRFVSILTKQPKEHEAESHAMGK
jgi:hypothetical protein